jgi:hypothetical protein
MRVTIHNESDAILTLPQSSHESGEFTKDQDPPARIQPNEIKSFQSEGSSVLNVQPTTGVEGEVRYQITANAANAGGLTIGWNSPLVESDYDNTFKTLCPGNWEVTHWGGQGHNGDLHVRLRRTGKRTVPHFHPHGRGFGFTNNWSSNLPVMTIGYLRNRLREAMPPPMSDVLHILPVGEDDLPLTRANQGMCGGMVYAVMDYFTAHLLPPTQEKSPDQVDDPVFQYIRNRLWDSFDVTGEGHRFLSYSSPHYPDSSGGIAQDFGYGKGRSWITYRETWQHIHQEIDAGRLAPLNLIQTKDLDIGKNHQVLAYGYERSGQVVTLYIYDPNEHAQNPVRYIFDISSTDGAVRISREPANDKQIHCVFSIGNYHPQLPPNGRRITSLRAALRATKGRDCTSVKSAMSGGLSSNVSVKEWFHSL